MGLEGFDTKKHIPEKHLFHMSCCALTMQEEKENGCEVIWDRVQAAPWRWDAGNGNAVESGVIKTTTTNKHHSNWKKSGSSHMFSYLYHFF